jgi:hypothetical protein
MPPLRESWPLLPLPNQEGEKDSFRLKNGKPNETNTVQEFIVHSIALCEVD